MEERETSVKGQYRITERGRYVVGKLEQLDVVHAYRTFLDVYHQIDDGRSKLVEWVDDEDVKWEISQKRTQTGIIDRISPVVSLCSDTDIYKQEVMSL